MSKVQFGISDVTVFERTETNLGTDSTITYSNPMAVPGAVSISLDPQGDQNIFYADNIKYWVGNTNQGYEGDLEIAMLPDDFKKKYLGYMTAANGNLVETDVVGKSFGMVFKFKTDTEDRYAVLYNCTVARPTEEHNTVEESADPDTITLTITVAGESVAYTGSDITATTVQAFKAEVRPSDSNYATVKTALALPTFQ